MTLTFSETIDRPASVVFDFVAVRHLANHPRWDPKMELVQLTDGPVAVGTWFQRRHTRIDTPVEGTMEVIEFEPDRCFAVIIRDQTPAGHIEVRSRMLVNAVADGRTELTIQLVLPGSERTMDPGMVGATLRRIKELVEAEEWHGGRTT